MKIYKKIFFSTLVTLFSLPVFSQDNSVKHNIVKLRPAGVWLQTLKWGNFSDYDLGLTYERVLTDKISGGFDLDFVFSGNTLFVLRPNVNVYLLDSAPQSLYVGGYFNAGFGNWDGWTHIGLGPKVGYQHLFLDDQLAVMSELGMGFGMFTDAAADGDGPGAGLNLYFTVGAGYAF